MASFGTFTSNFGNSFTTSDYIGAANICFSTVDYDTIQAKIASGAISAAAANAFDPLMGYRVTSAMLIESVTFDLADQHMLTEYFGDTFSTVYFGRSPTIIACTGKLSTLAGSNNKRNFMALYRDVLRLRKVARTGIVPVICFTGAYARGAFIDMNLERNSNVEDFYNMAFRFLVFDLLFVNARNTSGVTKLDIRFTPVN